MLIGPGNESRLDAWLSGKIDLPTEHTENFKDRRADVLKLCKKAFKNKEKELSKKHPPKLKVTSPDADGDAPVSRKRKTSRHSEPNSPRDNMEITSHEEPPKKQSRTGETETEEKPASSKKHASKKPKDSCEEPNPPKRSPSKETLAVTKPGGKSSSKEERARSGSKGEKKRHLLTTSKTTQPLVSEYEVTFNTIEKAYLGTLDLKTSNYGIPGAGYGMAGYGLPLSASGSYAMGGYGSNVLSQLRGLLPPFFFLDPF